MSWAADTRPCIAWASKLSYKAPGTYTNLSDKYKGQSNIGFCEGGKDAMIWHGIPKVAVPGAAVEEVKALGGVAHPGRGRRISRT